MNKVYYANLTTRKRRCVEVLSGRRKANSQKPTAAQADDVMLKNGFVRWPKNKPIPEAG